MTRKPKHTEGPWRWRPVCDEGKLIAMLLETEAPNQPCNDPCIMAAREDWMRYLHNRPQGEANAQLIAAAPELLEACKLAEATVRRLNRHNSANGTLDVLRDVIAKAEGDA